MVVPRTTCLVNIKYLLKMRRQKLTKCIMMRDRVYVVFILMSRTGVVDTVDYPVKRTAV
jgi:hypothetical protein